MTELNDRDDVIWLAGLLEGEGTFDLHRGKYPRVRVGMTDRDVVGRAATLLGANVRLSLKSAPAQATWHAEVSGEKAVAVMRAILPFMGSRRSGKIATILGTAQLGYSPAPARPKVLSAPGPQICRPPALR
ncbi:hypothetical protein ACXJJ3_32700 [Kribbella sp. WER1]